MSLQVLPEPSCQRAVDSVIIKETLFVIVSSRHYHGRGKASGKALSRALIHLPHGSAPARSSWEGLSRETSGCCVGRAPGDTPGMEQSQHRHIQLSHTGTLAFLAGGEKLFLALLLFVLLLVCVMFLLIKDGIFNICFLKKEAMIQVGTYFA